MTRETDLHRAAVVAEKMVAGIIRDLTDRRGLKSEWNQIDDDVKEEIVRKWQWLARDEVVHGFLS